MTHPTASVLFALARGRLAFTWGVSILFLFLFGPRLDQCRPADIASERPHGTILRVPSVRYIAHHTPRGSSVVLRFFTFSGHHKVKSGLRSWFAKFRPALVTNSSLMTP